MRYNKWKIKEKYVDAGGNGGAEGDLALLVDGKRDLVLGVGGSATFHHKNE
jgi:hypothetical protein